MEVSDTTLDFDLRVKGPLYARAGIQEYWVVDLKARRMVVHREPVAGVYQSIEAYSEDESVAPLAALDRLLIVRGFCLRVCRFLWLWCSNRIRRRMRLNRRKHHVSFDETVTALNDVLAKIFVDPGYSAN